MRLSGLLSGANVATAQARIELYRTEGDPSLGYYPFINAIWSQVSGRGSVLTPSPVEQYAAFQGLRILFVDDDADTRDLMASFFTLYGADVATAASVADGLNRFAALSPQLLVSDIAMPNQDGYTLIQAIRAWSPAQGGQVVAIALSAFAERTTQQRAIAAGFDCHVAKPIDPYELAAVMVRVLEAVRANGNPSAAG